MKHIRVPLDNDATVNELSQELDNIQKNGIENAPWLAYRYKPEVFFAIAVWPGAWNKNRDRRNCQDTGKQQIKISISIVLKLQEQ
jgi:hypothetical protein